jgi:hypothetical protein
MLTNQLTNNIQVAGTSKNPWFFEETIGTWMCQPKSKLQGFDFEE